MAANVLPNAFIRTDPHLAGDLLDPVRRAGYLVDDTLELPVHERTDMAVNRSEGRHGSNGNEGRQLAG